MRALENVAPAPRRRNRFHHGRHRHTTPLPPPCHTTIYFRCILTLRFSNLVPYVTILKTFHIKNLSNKSCLLQNWRDSGLTKYPKLHNIQFILRFFICFAEYYYPARDFPLKLEHPVFLQYKILKNVKYRVAHLKHNPKHIINTTSQKHRDRL